MMALHSINAASNEPIVAMTSLAFPVSVVVSSVAALWLLATITANRSFKNFLCAITSYAAATFEFCGWVIKRMVSFLLRAVCAVTNLLVLLAMILYSISSWLHIDARLTIGWSNHPLDNPVTATIAIKLVVNLSLLFLVWLMANSRHLSKVKQLKSLIMSFQWVRSLSQKLISLIEGLADIVVAMMQRLFDGIVRCFSFIVRSVKLLIWCFGAGFGCRQRNVRQASIPTELVGVVVTDPGAATLSSSRWDTVVNSSIAQAIDGLTTDLDSIVADERSRLSPNLSSQELSTPSSPAISDDQTIKAGVKSTLSEVQGALEDYIDYLREGTDHTTCSNPNV